MEDTIIKQSTILRRRSGRRPAVIEYLKKQTEGNVFFLVEVVRALAENVGGLDFIGSDHAPERLTTRGISEILRRRLNRIPAKWGPGMELAPLPDRQPDMNSLQAPLPPISL